MPDHTSRPAPNDQQWYRRVLGQFPTGVTLVTAEDDDGPVGMIVGSFASVSLDPPLVSFYPAKTSTTWPKIERAGRFCVNVLSSEHEHVCRTLMTKAPDAFERFAWTPSPTTGSPTLDEAVAWIDCEVASVTDAGDHWLVVGEVLDLDVGRPGMPMIFFRGGYGRFEAGSRIATELESGSRLRALDRARPSMELLAERYEAECIAAARIGHEIVLLASAGEAAGGSGLPSRIGERVPAVAPVGRSILAWSDDRAVAEWLAPLADPAAAEGARHSLEKIRERGYSVTVAADRPRPERFGLSDALDPGAEWTGAGDPESPTSVAVPVLADGAPLFAIALYGLRSGAPIAEIVDGLHEAARDATLTTTQITRREGEST